MPFVDILITPGKDGSLSTSVFRKPTHTDLYLQWDSHHTLTSKYSVIGTLQHRAQTICSIPQLLQKEEHLKSALKKCKYPTWALNKIKIKAKKQATNKAPTIRTNNNNQMKSYIVVAYYSGLSESIKKIGSKYGVQVYFKEAPPSRTSWCLPKIKIQHRSKVESSTDTNVTGWTVMKNTLESPQELLEKSSRNFWNPLLPYMATATSLFTMLPSTTLTLLGGRTWTWWEK